MIGDKQVGPFMGVDFDKTVKRGERTFRIITYQAYNAFGLIGSEVNGVAILDEDKKEVLARNIARIDQAYFGLTKEQNEEAERISGLSLKELVDFIDVHRPPWGNEQH